MVVQNDGGGGVTFRSKTVDGGLTLCFKKTGGGD